MHTRAKSKLFILEICYKLLLYKKLNRNSSLDEVKTKGVASWLLCDVLTSGCCSCSSVADVWDLAPALRWKTHFFGESDAVLTWADAISVEVGEMCRLNAFDKTSSDLIKCQCWDCSSAAIMLTTLNEFVLLFLLVFHFFTVISSHGSHHLPLFDQRSLRAS